MSRRAIALDRLVVLVVGLVLIALGVAGILWWAGHLPGDPTKVSTPGLVTSTRRDWWPWAVAGAGIVVVLLALRWLLAHVPRHGVKRLTLPGSDTTGRLEVATGSLTDAAAAQLGDTPGVRSAKAHARTERGQLLAVFDVTIEQGADLAVVAQAADATSADLRRALGRDDVACRVNIKPAARTRALSRVD